MRVTARFTAIAAAVLVVNGCSKEETSPPSRSGTMASPPPVVAAARAGRHDLLRQEVLAAEFRPFQMIDVHAKVAGYIKKIFVDVGDRVREGQTLAILEIPELTDEVARAQAQRSRSTAEVERQKEEVARANSNYQATHLVFSRLAGVAKTRPNLIAQQEIDDARAKDDSAAAQLAAAKAALASAQQEVGVSQADVQKTQTMNAYGTITAPFPGVVTRRYADTGTMVPAGTSANAIPIVQLSQNTLLRLVLPVPEAISAKVHVGDAVDVRVPALSRTFTGRVTRLADALSTATRTMDTQVDVPNPNLILIPGMYAEAVITVERRSQALSIPIGAVVADGKKGTVYRVNSSGAVEIRPVQLGLETSTEVEIVSGLDQGDVVITGNRSQLASGMKVQPKIAAASEGGK